MDRMARFASFETDIMMKGAFKRVNAANRKTCEEFIRANDHLSHDDFAAAVNRWGLGKSMPRCFSAMWALVLNANGVSPALIARRAKR